jgi:hypothetical protein
MYCKLIQQNAMITMGVTEVQGCQITQNKNGEIVPKGHKIHQMAFTKWLLIFQLAMKYSNVFHSKALQVLPKLGFSEWNYVYHLATDGVTAALERQIVDGSLLGTLPRTNPWVYLCTTTYNSSCSRLECFSKYVEKEVFSKRTRLLVAL